MPDYRGRGGIMGFVNNTIRDSQMIDDRRNMAEMAAQRFDKIGGDQAQYWAKSLRANPRVAMGMADQYGGFASIEGGMLQSRAAGQAQEARTAASPDELFQIYAQGGKPEQAEHLAKALQIQRESAQGPEPGQRRIVAGADGFKYYEDTGERVLPGLEKTSDRRDTTTDTLGRSVYIDTGEPVIESERSMTMPRREIVKRFDSRSTDFKPNLVTLRRYEQFKELPAGAAGDFSRLQILGKMLDDSSVVREGEAELMRVMGASTGREALRKMQNLYDVTGIFTPEARAAVEMAIESTYIANARNAINQRESWDAENTSLGLSEDESKRATPYNAEIKRFRESVREYESDVPDDSYNAAVEYYKRLGVDPEKITAKMIADVIEQMEGEIAAESDQPEERKGPQHFVPLQQAAGGQRALTPQDMQAMMARGGR